MIYATGQMAVNLFQDYNVPVRWTWIFEILNSWV